MKNSFIDRVSAERRVLSVVNELFSRSQALTGLSSAAITRWRAVVGWERASSVVHVLVTIAEQCQRLSDRSNDVFMTMEKAESEMIEKQLVVLQKEVRRLANE